MSIAPDTVKEETYSTSTLIPATGVTLWKITSPTDVKDLVNIKKMF